MRDSRLQILDAGCRLLRLTLQTLNFKFVRLASSLLIIIHLTIFAVNAQEIVQPTNFHQWGAVTLFNGLPSDNVRAIAQTPDGILWFGTQNGLARFDGRRVENVDLENLPSPRILTLEIDSDGTLWIGTDAGAGRVINDRFVPVAATLGKPITAITIGEIGVLVSPDTIFSYHHNPDDSLDVTASATRDLQFTDAERGTDDNLYLGSRGRGILIADGNDFLEINSRPRPYFVNALHRDETDNLWIGAKADRDSANGLFIASDIGRPNRIGENIGTVTTFAETGAGDVWVGTENNGLLRFRGARQLEHYTFENTAGGLRSNRIYTLLTDREGVVWIGTNRGVCRFDAASPANQIVSDNANGNFVRTLYKSRANQIYAGTNRGFFAAVGNGWLATESLAAKTVYTIAESAAGQTIIGTSNGIFSFDGKSIAPGDARSIAVFKGATYAAIFGRGVIQIENQTVVFSNTAPTAIFADAANLYVGTAQDGVFIFDGKAVRQEKSLENLRGAAIRKITKEGENVFWFSGETGLYRLENGELNTIIADQDVRDFSINGADVWAATLKGGLYHLRFDADLGWLTAAVNVEQGLPSEQIFSILPINNYLLIGTNRGVVNYAPSVIAPKIVAARVLSQRLYSPAEIARTINLEFPQNSLLLEVAGLSSRTFPEQFQYVFLLKNQNGDVLAKKLSNDAQFSPADLPPGIYRIEARAFNKDLLASESLIVEFTVAGAPFPWTATALGVLLAIALVGLIWAIVERRRIKQRSRELAAARFDLANEAERERKRIAQDLHDQTLADLRSLMLMSDELPSDTTKFRQEIEAVSTEIRRICEDLSPSVLENVGLAPALEFLLTRTIESHEFHAAENTEEQLNFAPNVQMQIYRIAQEVLTNIKHHSDARSVQMTIEISPENEFVLTIADDGGFFNPAAIVSKGRGIANIKSRAALIKAETIWRESETKGTTFRLVKNL